MRLAVQESLLPGANLSERIDAAREMGYDALELRSGDLLANRAATLSTLAQNRFPISSICTNPQQDPVVEEREVREARLAAWRDLLLVARDIGASGIIMVPIRRPHRLPDLTPLYTSSELELALLYRILDCLLPEAERVGVTLLVEPLNFYEAMLVPTIEKAREICQHANSPRLRLMADTFHMNIMEADPEAALLAAGPYLGHVHLSDSNRELPGQGHIDFARIFATLTTMGYNGYLALEALPPNDPWVETAASARFLREQEAMVGATQVT